MTFVFAKLPVIGIRYTYFPGMPTEFTRACWAARIDWPYGDNWLPEVTEGFIFW